MWLPSLIKAGAGRQVTALALEPSGQAHPVTPYLPPACPLSQGTEARADEEIPSNPRLGVRPGKRERKGDQGPLLSLGAQSPALFPQLNSLQPLALMMGIPLVDPKELASTQGEPDRTYESSSQTLMAK